MEKEIDTWSDSNELICPYCGYKRDIDFEMFENADIEFDEEEAECWECGKYFRVQRKVFFTYNTYKDEILNE